MRLDSFGMMDAVLPHETTHVVLAGQFGSLPVPRWADEGIAVLTEPPAKVAQHRQNLLRCHQEGMLFGLKELMVLENYPQEPRRVKIEEIQRVVARQYNVSRADLLSSRRTANVVRPRQVAMYLAKTLTLRSLPEIGRRFGGRDHTTVLHAVRKIESLIGTDNVLATEIESLKSQLQE